MDALWKLLAKAAARQTATRKGKLGMYAASGGLLVLGLLMAAGVLDVYRTNRVYIRSQAVFAPAYDAMRWLRQYDLTDYYRAPGAEQHLPGCGHLLGAALHRGLVPLHRHPPPGWQRGHAPGAGAPALHRLIQQRRRSASPRGEPGAPDRRFQHLPAAGEPALRLPCLAGDPGAASRQGRAAAQRGERGLSLLAHPQPRGDDRRGTGRRYCWCC